MFQSDLVTIQPVKGRGLGVVANDDIKADTVIFTEKPLLVYYPAPKRLRHWHLGMITQLQQLGEEGRRQYFQLANAFGCWPLINIARTNGFPLGSAPAQAGIFPLASRLNHACAPNCHWDWNKRLGTLTVRVTMSIEKGDEATIAYIDDFSPLQERQEVLARRYAFRCNCAICSALSAMPDLNRLFGGIRDFVEQLSDFTAFMANPVFYISALRSILFVADERGLSRYQLGWIMWDCFLVNATHSDEARAVAFACSAQILMELCKGKDDPVVAAIEEYANDPTRHPLWGRTTDWATKSTDLPSSKDVEKFDKWSWGRCVLPMQPFANVSAIAP